MFFITVVVSGDSSDDWSVANPEVIRRVFQELEQVFIDVVVSGDSSDDWIAPEVRLRTTDMVTQ